jgi:hypothetical protein
VWQEIQNPEEVPEPMNLIKNTKEFVTIRKLITD